MKRTMSMFAAVAALAVGFLFAAPAANAQNVPVCHDALSSLHEWPYNTGAQAHAAAQYCTDNTSWTPTAQDGSAMAGALHGYKSPGPANDLYTKLAAFQSPGGDTRQWYIFSTYSQYVAWWNANMATAPEVPKDPDHDGGFTARQPGTNIPIYTVILNSHLSLVTGVRVFTDDAQVTSHESGHWADYFYRVTLGSATAWGSDGANWGTLVGYDWSHTNNMPGFPYPIGVNQHHNCDANPVGMFRGYQAEDGEYICTGSTGTGGALRAPDFSGNNQNVLSVQSHPGIFGSNHEIFAEEVPIQTSHNDGGLIGADHFFNDSGEGNRFVCTKFVVFTLFQTGNHPTNAQLTAKGCPTIARW